MNRIVSLFVILAVISIGTTYMFGILSTESEQINVTGTGYEEAYNSNVKIQNGTSKILAPFGIIIGCVALFSLVKMFSGRRRKFY